MRSIAPCPSVNGADAHALLRDDRLVVLAIETLGHSGAAEIVAVAVLNRHGEVQLTTRIRPTRPIPALADAPSLEVVWPSLAALLTGRIVVSREIAADRQVLQRAARRLGATLMYADWRRVGTGVCRSTPRTSPFYPSRSALTEARVTLAALRALTVPPIHRQPPRQLFWRYL